MLTDESFPVECDAKFDEMDCDEFARELGLAIAEPCKVASLPSELPSYSPRDLLGVYYSDFFPIKKLVRWLNYGTDKQYLANREFSFTLTNDIYIRYLSFENAAAFSARLQKDLPVKIDVGAVYNSRPTERKTIGGTNFRPVEHELVFDIDMTDYNDVRTCCQDKSVCRKCWKFLAVAVKILDASLREDFGFQNILWVFSGRRGVHCWVCDSRARQMSPSARKAVVSFLEVVKGGADTKKKVSLAVEIPSSIERSIKVLKSQFETIALADQDVLASSAKRAKFVTMIPDESIKSYFIQSLELRNQVAELWSDEQLESVAKPADFWKMFVELYEESSTTKSGYSSHRLPAEIQLSLLYPRLDSNVSTQLNHLLKSPFCVHPDTGMVTWSFNIAGKVCIPFRPELVDDFDPSAVPTIQELAAHLFTKQASESPLTPSLRLFDEFICGCEESRQLALVKQRDSDERTLTF